MAGPVSYTYTVKKGDTVWALSRRALQNELGRKPTNAEIQALVNKVSVPSGNRNLIYPGEKITIPIRTPRPTPPGRRPAPGGRGNSPSRPESGGSNRSNRRSSDAAIGLVTGAAVGGAVGAAAATRRQKNKGSAKISAAKKKSSETASKSKAMVARKPETSAKKSGPKSSGPVSQQGPMSTTRTVKGKNKRSGKGGAARGKGSSPAQAYKNARAALAKATTKPGLDLAAKRISKSNISAADKERLRALYKQRVGKVSAGQLGSGASKAAKLASAAGKAARGTTAGKAAAAGALILTGAGKAAAKKATKQAAKKAAKKATKKKTTRKRTSSTRRRSS